MLLHESSRIDDSFLYATQIASRSILRSHVFSLGYSPQAARRNASYSESDHCVAGLFIADWAIRC